MRKIMASLLLAVTCSHAAHYGLTDEQLDQAFQNAPQGTVFRAMTAATFKPLDFKGQDAFFTEPKKNLMMSLRAEALSYTPLGPEERDEFTTDGAFGHLEMGSGMGAATFHYVQPAIKNYIRHLKGEIPAQAPIEALAFADNYRTRDPESGIRGDIAIPRRRGPGVTTGAGESAAETIQQAVSNMIHGCLQGAVDEGIDLSKQLLTTADGADPVNGEYGLLTEEDSILEGIMHFPFFTSGADYLAGTDPSKYMDVSQDSLSELIGILSEGESRQLPRFITIDTDPVSRNEMYGTLVNAWNVLLPRGLIVIDDYNWNHRARPGLFPVKNGLRDFFKRHVQSLHSSWASLDPASFTDHPPARVYPYVDGEKQDFTNEGGSPPSLSGTLQPILEFHELWGSDAGKWITVIRKDNSADLELEPVFD